MRRCIPRQAKPPHPNPSPPSTGARGLGPVHNHSLGTTMKRCLPLALFVVVGWCAGAGRLFATEGSDLTVPAASLNLAWVVLTAFLIFMMQAGFALVETGLTRAKNVAHTMAMNVLIYALGAIGFWVCGFALMFGGYGTPPSLGGTEGLGREFTLPLAGRDFGLCGHDGFFLAGPPFGAALLAL